MPKDEKYKRLKIGKSDQAFLRRLWPIVEGIAEVFGSNCEVVLHSLEDPLHSVIQIKNGHITGREEGFPLTDLAVEILGRIDSLRSDLVGSYYGKTNDGRPLKSVTMVLRGTSGKVIGFMCINIDLSATLLDLQREFLPVGEKFSIGGHQIESFPSNVSELVSETIELAMTRINSQRRMSPSEKNKLIVHELYKAGIFNIKGVIDIVAKEMGVSRYSVYNYIREIKPQVE